MTKDDEAKVMRMLEAFEGGKRVADLEEIDPEKAEGARIEVTDSDGESRQASLGTLLGATDAKERLEDLEEKVPTLERKVETLEVQVTPLKEDLEARQEAASKVWAAQSVSSILYTIDENGVFGNVRPVAPESWDDRGFDATTTLKKTNDKWSKDPICWHGKLSLPGVNQIKTGDQIYYNGAYYSVRAMPKKMTGYGQEYIHFPAECGGKRYGFTSFPCRQTTDFIVVSGEDYDRSHGGQIGLVVRIPGLFVTNRTPYTRDAGLWERLSDYSFIVLDYSGRNYGSALNNTTGLTVYHMSEEREVWRSDDRTSLGMPQYYQMRKVTAYEVNGQGIAGEHRFEMAEGTTHGFTTAAGGDKATLFPYYGAETLNGSDLSRAVCFAPYGSNASMALRYMELPLVRTYVPTAIQYGASPRNGNKYEISVGVDQGGLLKFDGSADDLDLLTGAHMSPHYGRLPIALTPGNEISFKDGSGNLSGVTLQIVERDADMWWKLAPLFVANNVVYDGGLCESHFVALAKHDGHAMGLVRYLVRTEPLYRRHEYRPSALTATTPYNYQTEGCIIANEVYLNPIRDINERMVLTDRLRVFNMPSFETAIPMFNGNYYDDLWQWMVELYNRSYTRPDGDAAFGRLYQHEILSLRPGDVLAPRGEAAYQFIVTTAPLVIGVELGRPIESSRTSTPAHILIKGQVRERTEDGCGDGWLDDVEITFKRDVIPIEDETGTKSGWYIKCIRTQSWGLIECTDDLGAGGPQWH